LSSARAAAIHKPAGDRNRIREGVAMARPIIYGTEFSTYVRTVRMAFAEKPADYELVDVSVLAGAHRQPEHLARNPFGTVPAFAHEGFALYETGAIIRYVDQVFSGTALTPADPRKRARMNQVISIIDYHGYNALILKIVVQRLFTALIGGTTDDAVIAEGMPKAKLCLAEFERLMGGAPFLAGEEVSLADLYLMPIVFYLLKTPEGGPLLAPHRALQRWWEAMLARPSAAETEPKFA
jgi:glutathione S-transferase